MNVDNFLGIKDHIRRKESVLKRKIKRRNFDETIKAYNDRREANNRIMLNT